jgi:uncharacterized protein
MSEVLSNIIKKQKLEILADYTRLAGVLIERFQSQKLQEVLKSPLIKVILGPRRAGKSTLALQAIGKSKFAYFNFEDEGLPLNIGGEDLIKALNTVYGEVDYYFFDEIQVFNRWEQFLHRLHRENKNIIVTGSNAHLLSEELASALTGRHIAIEVLPFSFSEIVNTVKTKSYDINQYLTSGGFPEVVLGKVDYRIYLATLWDSVILKDIVKRKKVRNISGLSDVLSLLLSALTSKFNVDSLCATLGNTVTAPTVKKFLAYADQAYLICQLQLFSSKNKLRIKSDRKAYAVDNGFYNAQNVKTSPNQGALLENVVFNELRVRSYIPNYSLFYYVTRSGFEVDFLLRSGHRNTEAIQVCFNLSSLKTRERELRALYEICTELGVEKLTIVTFDEDGVETYKDKRIELKSIQNWLLTNNK